MLCFVASMSALKEIVRVGGTLSMDGTLVSGNRSERPSEGCGGGHLLPLRHSATSSFCQSPRARLRSLPHNIKLILYLSYITTAGQRCSVLAVDEVVLGR